MECAKCRTIITIKDTEDWITLLCRCKCVKMYPDGRVMTVPYHVYAKNKRLQEMLQIMCKERNANFYYVPIKYSGDNGVMIAAEGIAEFKSGIKNKELDIKPRWRLDDLKVTWNYL